MKILRVIMMLSLSSLIFLTGCNPPTVTEQPTTNPTQTAPSTQAPDITPTTSIDPRPTLDSTTGTAIQQAYPWDYSYMWWPDGYTGNVKELYAATGNYALSFNESTGYISRFGVIDGGGLTEGMALDNSVVKSLPAFLMRYSITYDNTTHNLNFVEPSEADAAIRMLESGRFLQRMDLLYLQGKDNDKLYGRSEITVLPEYFAINFEVYPKDERINNAVMSLKMEINSIYTSVSISQDKKSAVLRSESGEGYSVIIPNELDATISQSGKYLLVDCNVSRLSRNKFTGFGIIILPSENANSSEVELFRNRDKVKVSAMQLSPRDRTQKVTYDATHGMYSIDAGKAFDLAEGELTDKDLDTYEKIRFTVENPTNSPIRVPLQFVKDQPLSVTGPSPMILDPKTGEPTGHAIQITRNWHGYDSSTAADSPRRCWEGKWYHCYTIIEVPANSSVTYDFCVSYARWGGIESVVHSQLCLAGWGGQKIWESCSLGAYGESFCYDVGRGYTWCTMGDICAFGLYSRINGQKYNWTTNTGGADFMGIYDQMNNQLKVKDLRILYKNHGPNLSEVLYSGMIGDKVKFDATVSTPRTNDISMAYQTFTYTFLKDTKYTRMWFYQFGADSYNYDYWDRMAVGNDSGVISFNYNGQSFSGEFAVPKIDGYADYIGHKGCNAIQMPGNGAWFAFLGAPKNQSKGNKAISVKEYKAIINGKEYTQPSFSIRTTSVWVNQSMGWDSAGYEINPPVEADGIIKAGSTVSFTVHYYNLPAHKSDYYGQGEYLNKLNASKYDTWELAYEYALRNNISLTAQKGNVLRINTPLIESTGKKDGVVAQFTLTGGIGYVPITISKVDGYSGWRLEQKVNGQWQTLDQGVHGNDYWQAFYCEDGTYELTFNVPASIDRFGSEEFRLVK